MTDFEIKIPTVYSVVLRENELVQILKTYNRDLAISCSKICNLISSSKSAIRKSLNNSGNQLEQNISNLSRCSSTLEKISRQYVTAESSIKNTKTVYGKVKEAKDSLDWLDIFSEMGAVGSAISLIEDIAEGNVNAVGVMDCLAQVTGSVAKNIKEDGIDWVDALLGTSKYYETKSFLEGLTDEFGQYVGKTSDSVNMNPTAKKVMAASKWAGAVVSLGGSVLSNLEEFKDNGGISNARFWGETVIETGIEIGKAAVISSAIGAAAGAAIAAGVITAPAWVVGAGVTLATGAVVWGLDKMSTALVGKDFTEVVSDTVCDITEGAAEVISDAVGGVNSFFGEIFSPVWA